MPDDAEVSTTTPPFLDSEPQFANVPDSDLLGSVSGNGTNCIGVVVVILMSVKLPLKSTSSLLSSGK